MGLLDDLEFLKKRKPNLLADVRQLQGPSEPYLRQQYPEIYGGLGGLLGMAPDEMAGSVLDPNTARVRSGAQIGFPVGTAAQVAPLAPMLAPAVKAGARALGPTAVRMGEGYLQRQGLMPQLDVYHGSPHKFDRFDASKIGTGEGAQAYGHGIYTAENPGIAQGYADRLGGGQFGSTSAAKGSTADRLSAMFDNDGSNFRKGSRDISIIAKNLAEKTKVDANGLVHHQFKDGSEWIGSQSGWDVANTEKNLYKVDLPDEKIAKMLDWDRPLSEQPDVMRALKGTDYEVGVSQKEAERIADMRLRQEADEWAEMTGGDPVDYSNNVDWEKYVDGVRKESGSIDSSITGKDLHRMVMRDEGYRPDLFDSENYQVGTSETLRGMGIPGIKYLDATSRGAGTGTRNFVTFPGEEQSMTILERNGQPMVARTQQQDAAPDLLQYQQMLDDEERRKSAGLLFR